MEDLLYEIGETLIMEIDKIKNITYSNNEQQWYSLFLEMDNNKKYKLTLTLE
ncbi:MAG: hypothetical protein RR357_06645 [Clostridia bacterium]